MSQRPLIGLTMRSELETRRFYLGRDYSEAIKAAGGIPLHIALIPDVDYIANVVANLDGLLLPGSDSDVDPALFGEDPHPKLKRVVPEKDVTEQLVLAAAEEKAKPVFAICYGMQALNVSRGGSLIQDIESQVENSIKHEQGMPLDRASHSIKVADRGILASLVTTENVKVNSHHHQAIRSVGNNLRASAWTNDGVVECIEDERDGRFVVGVQWHPELSWRTDELSTSLFRKFLEACEKSKSAGPSGKNMN